MLSWTQNSRSFYVRQMYMQKTIPVLISIAIIISVALLRERSRTVAALLVTLPINIPLAMWIASNSSGSDSQIVYNFARTSVIGLGIALVWILVVFFALRAGWTLASALAAGYGAWAVLIAGLFALRVLSL